MNAVMLGIDTLCPYGTLQVSVLNGDKKMTTAVDATPAGIA